MGRGRRVVLKEGKCYACLQGKGDASYDNWETLSMPSIDGLLSFIGQKSDATHVTQFEHFGYIQHAPVNCKNRT